jgi:hypothetical protein
MMNHWNYLCKTVIEIHLSQKHKLSDTSLKARQHEIGNFFFLVSWDGVRLSPLGTAATV